MTAATHQNFRIHCIPPLYSSCCFEKSKGMQRLIEVVNVWNNSWAIMSWFAGFCCSSGLLSRAAHLMSILVKANKNVLLDNA